MCHGWQKKGGKLRYGKNKEQDQKDLLNLPLCKVMNCYINCSHCEGQNLTELQSGRLASTDLN